MLFLSGKCIAVAITDNRLKLLEEVMRNTLRSSIFHLTLKSNPDVSFTDQLNFGIENLKHFYNQRKSGFKVYMFCLSLGTSEIVRQVNCLPVSEYNNISKNVKNNLLHLKSNIYEIFTESIVIFTPLPYLGMEKSDKVIKEFNDSLVKINEEDHRLDSTFHQMISFIPLSFYEDNSFILSKNNSEILGRIFIEFRRMLNLQIKSQKKLNENSNVSSTSKQESQNDFINLKTSKNMNDQGSKKQNNQQKLMKKNMKCLGKFHDFSIIIVIGIMPKLL